MLHGPMPSTRLFSICQRTIVTVVSAAEPEPKLRIAAPAPLYLSDLKKFYRKKPCLLKKFLVNCYNFNPITKVKKGNFQDIKLYVEPELEPKDIFSASQY
jgi:hypothetical protein